MSLLYKHVLTSEAYKQAVIVLASTFFLYDNLITTYFIIMNNEKVPLQLQRISYTEEFILFQLHYNVVAII